MAKESAIKQMVEIEKKRRKFEEPLDLSKVLEKSKVSQEMLEETKKLFELPSTAEQAEPAKPARLATPLKLRGALRKIIFGLFRKPQPLQMPKFSLTPQKHIIMIPKVEDLSKVDIRYPLLEPFADARINWDASRNELRYNVIEPQLDEEEKKVYDKIVKALLEIVEVELSSIKKPEEAVNYIEQQIQKIVITYGIRLRPEQYIKIMYFIYRNFVGLNEIEPLMHDAYIEDIGADGVSVPIYVVHRKYGSIRTNIIYNDLEQLRDFVVKLSERCGRYISYAEPLLDGSLPSGSRVQASLAGDVTTHGPTFSIRKFTEEPLSPIDLLELGTVSSEVLAYLWLIVESGASILVCGGVSTGKTTLLNVLSMFIPTEAKIISIEDTREINLPHENWVPSVARVGFGTHTETGRYGEVTMFDLLKESFRQNPDYVIVGEVRGSEAYVMFQGMASIPAKEKVLLLNDNNLRRLPIGEVAESKNFKVPCFDLENKKAEFAAFSKINHGPRKELYKIITCSGREVITTPDHSLFTKKGDAIVAMQTSEMKENDSIIIPGRLPSGFNDIEYLNLLELFSDIRVFAPQLIKKAVEKLGFERASKICGVKSISDYYANFKRSKPSAMKLEAFKELMAKAGFDYENENIKVRFDKRSESCDAKIKVTMEFLKFLGYFISEGSLDMGRKSNKISFYSKNEKIIEDMKNCIVAATRKRPRIREVGGFGSCTELSFNHKVLFELLLRFCGRGSSSRKIPDFIFGLSKEKIGNFLEGLYNGDGSFNKRHFGYYTISKELANDLAYLLLAFGIVARIKKRLLPSGKIIYDILFYTTNEIKEFLKFVRPLKKTSFLLRKEKENRNKIGDLYVDKVKKIERIVLDRQEIVFDFSVPRMENFVGGFGGVLLHNSGHACMGTMHAGRVDDVIHRLETPPIELSPSLVETLDIILVMVHARERGKSARRIKEIAEIESIDATTGVARTNKIYTWLPGSDTFQYVGYSWLLQKISKLKGISIEELQKELVRRKKVLEWMQASTIKNYKRVAELLSEYHKNPKKILKLAEKS